MGLCLLVFLFTLIARCSTIQPMASGQDAGSVAADDTKVLYTPVYLLQLGSELKSPLLRLLGLTLCNVRIWSAWSEWSECSVKRNFGWRKRTRVFGNEDKHCLFDEKSKVETDTSLCEGFCASGFNLTKHGFYVKYIPEKVNYDVAEKRCAKDGAHVININSDQKLQDIKNMNVNFSAFILVDGRRANVESPWVFSHGAEPDVLKWNADQPGNTATELCLVYHITDWRLHDSACTHEFLILCEKTV